jgi:hypothetical protein
MARAVEVSDDDFPDLAQLLKSGKPESKSATTTVKRKTRKAFNTSRDPVGDATETSESKVKRNDSLKIVKGQHDEKRETRERSKEIEGDVQPVVEVKTRPKKRILNQKNDNPLLRPLGNSTRDHLSPDISDISIKVRSKEDARTNKARQPDPSTRQSTPEEQPQTNTKVSRPKVEKKPAPKATKKALPRYDSTEEEDYSSDGLSDFIVNDSSFLDDESVVEAPAPKSTRRLVRGRKPRSEDSDDEDLGVQMKKLTFNDDPFTGSSEVSRERDLREFADNYEAENSPPPKPPKKVSEETRSNSTEGEKVHSTLSRPLTSSSEIDNPFTLRLYVANNAIPHIHTNIS